MVWCEYHKYKQAQKKSEEMRIRDIVRCSRNTNRRVFFSFQREGVSVYDALMAMRMVGCAQMQSVDETRQRGMREANKFDLARDASLYERARKSAL